MNLPTSTCITAEPPRLPELQSKGNLLNAKDSFDWLAERQDNFVGWTYTINLKVWTFLRPQRLIVGRQMPEIRNSKIRLASCCHVKCYLAPDGMLVGSMNLVAPTIEDLCYLIKDKGAIAHMKKQFNVHWKALSYAS